MFRAARRLRLEYFEDRSLPSAGATTPHPPGDPSARVATAGHEADEEDPAEYANSSKASSTATGAVQPGRPMVPDYVVAAYPAAPPMPTAPAPRPESAAVESVVSGAPLTSPATAAPVPAPIPVNSTPPPAPIPAASDRDFAPPQDDHPDAIPTDLPAGPPAALGDPPAVPDGEFPPVGSVLPSFDDLSLQLNLAGWANAASRLFSGLDAAVGLPDAESPWARLGYWALVIGTVGVTVELTRQGLRAKQPEPGSGPPFPVTR